MPASYSPTEPLSIEQVQERTGMGKSNIYRLIALGQFPRPIRLSGSKWIPAEVDEYIQLRKDARDHQYGPSNFAPRPKILSDEGGAQNESSSDNKPETSSSQLPSMVRILSPEVCEALRLLKLDIPELYLNPKAWRVSLAVVKVELASTQRTKKASNGKSAR